MSIHKKSPSAGANQAYRLGVQMGAKRGATLADNPFDPKTRPSEWLFWMQGFSSMLRTRTEQIAPGATHDDPYARGIVEAFAYRMGEPAPYPENTPEYLLFVTGAEDGWRLEDVNRSIEAFSSD